MNFLIDTFDDREVHEILGLKISTYNMKNSGPKVQGALSRLHKSELTALQVAQEKGLSVVLMDQYRLGGAGGFFHPNGGDPMIVLGVTLTKRIPRTVITHELVHFDQYQRGDLDMTEDGEVTWQGQVYDCMGMFDPHYLDYPWEVEAYQKTAEYRSRYGWFSTNHYLRLSQQGVKFNQGVFKVALATTSGILNVVTALRCR